MKSVLYKLYKDKEFVFPPTINAGESLDVSEESSPSKFLNCLITEVENKNQANDEIMDGEYIKRLNEQNKLSNKSLFKKFRFFLSREINIELFEFLVKSFGAECFYHSENFNSDLYRNSDFTHIIVDRVVLSKDKKPNTEYVQA